MKRYVIFFSLILSVCAHLRAGDDVLRVDATTPMQLAYAGGEQPEAVKFAADELRQYCSKLLHTTLAWRTYELNTPLGCYVVRLTRAGQQPSLLKQLIGSNGTCRINVSKDSITIAAKDPANLLGAVYELLESQGCEWLYPGPEGEFIPRKDRLSFPCGTRDRQPDFSMRGLYPVDDLQRYSPQDVVATLDWMAKNRFNYFTAIYNYGWPRLGKLALREAKKRGIQVVVYLWSFELFLPLELGREHPEYFALVDGKRRADYNVKRCASNPEAIRLYVDSAIKFLRAHSEIDQWIIIPNDGYHWCQCDDCKRLPPKDQWAAFFVPLLERVSQELPHVRLENFIYVDRYDLPKNIAPYRTAKLDHFFDTFPRNKWFTLREPINTFLATSLYDWRTHVDGRVWIFEDLMKHATCGIPFPGVELLAADMRAAKAENVQGYLFESYLQGWNSFAADLWILARLCCDTSSDVRELQRRYFRMLLGSEAEKMLGFYERFGNIYLPAARRKQDFYWYLSVPEGSRDYAETVRSIDAGRVPPVGQRWLSDQLSMSAVLAEIRRRQEDSLSQQGTEPLFGRMRREDLLDVAKRVLDAGRAMNGIVMVHGQLSQFFMRKYGRDALGFVPRLPNSFDPEVRSFFGHQKFWDTLAEWEAEGKYPQDNDCPEKQLRAILRRAIQEELASQ